jgi:hypothetical protein
MSVRHRTSIRRHLENRHGELHHEWTTPGFLDKLLAGGNNAPANMLVNASLVTSHPQSTSDGSSVIAAAQNSQQISPNMTQTDHQTEGTACLLWSKCTRLERRVLNLQVPYVHPSLILINSFIQRSEK